MEEMYSFGYWVRRRRKALDLTQAALARQVACSLATIKKIELDQRRPSGPMAERLADCLQVSGENRKAFLQAARGARFSNRLSLDGTPVQPGQAFQAQPGRSNLPAPVNRLVGRQAELGALRALFDRPQVRLVTLTGPGGVGKTRLALEAAAEQVGSFRDGAWLVELAPLSDPSFLPQQVATALGLQQVSQISWDDLLASAMRSSRLLLVLDNCEHLVEACARLAQGLLARCPGLVILATSREPLRIAGEVVFPVAPLDLPDLEEPSMESFAKSGAVHLFVERAQDALPSFSLTPDNSLLIAQICRRLDGLPLALELAAVRVRSLSLADLDRHLDGSLRLLSGGGRAALPKQQTLQAALDWSHALLVDDERVLFRRLTVFAGGFTLPAVQAVCLPAGTAIEEVVRLVGQFVEKSLIVAPAGSSGSRYRYLELVRRYGAEKLDAAGEEATFRERHFQYFYKLALELEPKLSTEDGIRRLDQLEAELDNLRLALRWSLETDREDSPLLGMRLAVALLRFWSDRCYFQEGFEWIERALAAVNQQDPHLFRDLGRAFHAAGALAHERMDPRDGELFEKAIVSSRRCEDWETVSGSLALLAKIRFFQRDHQAALALIEESIQIAQETGSRWELAMALSIKGGLLSWKELQAEDALAVTQASIRLFDELGDHLEASANHSQLGWIYYRSGDYSPARRACEKALEAYRANKDKAAMAYACEILANTCWMLEDYDATESYARQAVTLRREVGHSESAAGNLLLVAIARLGKGDEPGAIEIFRDRLSRLAGAQERRSLSLDMTGWAVILSAHGAARRAAWLTGAIAAIWNKAQFHPFPAEQKMYDRAFAAARARLQEAAYAAAWDEGRQIDTGDFFLPDHLHALWAEVEAGAAAA